MGLTKEASIAGPEESQVQRNLNTSARLRAIRFYEDARRSLIQGRAGVSGRFAGTERPSNATPTR